ncbi:phosphatidate cytidylyltransferase [Roseovarius azorensis]|uniref:Phosphatidate cytidylyltransferase n=1 Tax=Roseovarius azorensis TaxID=1287727 RepID=A0A1H7LWQ7_9RHOB|nr:phosphatidate cytidylyltransferase [Roseovarius azorensis]SEL03299.1 phosphatidate cytidylyltransferase [Roseovarius azorensis]
MSVSARWSDLAPRMLSGVAMIALGAWAIWIGGVVFAALVCVLAGLMIWEGARMFGAPDSMRSGVLAVVAMALALWLPGMLVLPLLVSAGLVAASSIERERGPFLALALWSLLGCYAMGMLRAEAGLIWVLWLVAVVVISDVAGYFAGRMIGGPKFWPRFSPRKTWSGTVAGWVGAAVIGLIFAAPTGAGLALVPVSVLVGFAGQMGDIAESAVKRLRGVKDSSNLIPGHGGVLDRFDAMLGAALVVVILWVLGLLPGVA